MIGVHHQLRIEDDGILPFYGARGRTEEAKKLSQAEVHKKAVGRGPFLKGAGAVLVLVAAGGVWRAADQGVFSAGGGPAYEPWENWRDGGVGPMALVGAAILASNPHNSQPWLFRVGRSSIDLFADTERNIGAVDPYLREMYAGVGCALENLLLAGGANGYAHQLTLMPDDSETTHAARVDLSPGKTDASDLYEAIPNRHTNRAAYDTERPISRETLASLNALGRDDPDVNVFWFSTPEERHEVGDLTIAATEAFIADEEQSRDSHAWFRHDWDDLQRKRDGVTYDAAGLSPLANVGGKMLPEGSEQTSNEYWMAGTRDTQVPTAAAFGIIAVRDDRDDAQRMNAGRLWQRMHLWATTQKLAVQPLNQIHERVDREAALSIEPRFTGSLKDLIGDPGWRGIFTFRTGYPTTEALKSPRRATRDVLV